MEVTREPKAGLSRTSLIQACLAVVPVLLFGLMAALRHRIIHRSHWNFTDDVTMMRGMLVLYALLACSFASAWLLVPAVDRGLEVGRARTTAKARRMWVVGSVVAACVFVSGFIVEFGRWQFGGWDYGMLTEIGWRQLLGQRPYVDFVTPTPPFFNLGSVLAFRLFGVSWNANLYLAAIFASVTLVWIFVLLRRAGVSAAAALGVSFAIEAATMLTCCFWWFNDTTLVLAAIFFLCCLLLPRAPRSRLVQVSFVVSLAVLPLMKPNIAGVTIVLCVVLLLITLEARERWRLVLLTVAGTGLSLLLFLVGHVSLAAMIETYRGVAKVRGANSAYDFAKLRPGDQAVTAGVLLVLFVPLFSFVGPMMRDVRQRRIRQAFYWLMFPVAGLVAVYGVAGNADYRDLECTLILIAFALLILRREVKNRGLRRLTIALICGLAISDLFFGAMRLRVYGVGLGAFFEWIDNQHRFDSGFLKDLRGSNTLLEADAQVRQAVGEGAKPVFLGPRLDWEYAALRLEPPLHLAPFFEPGTSFGAAQAEEILRTWHADRFQTLVFLKDDYTYYPEYFRDWIRNEYVRDDQFPRLTVYHRRPDL